MCHRHAPMAGPVLATPAHWTPCAGSPHAQTLHCDRMTCCLFVCMHASEALATTGCIVCRTVWSKCSNIQPFAAKLPKSPHAQTLRCNKRTTGMDRLHTVQCVVHHICMSQGKASAPHQRVTRDHMQRSSRTAITQHGCTLTTPLQRMLVWAVCRKHAQIIKPVLEISACWTLCAGSRIAGRPQGQTHSG